MSKYILFSSDAEKDKRPKSMEKSKNLEYDLTDIDSGDPKKTGAPRKYDDTIWKQVIAHYLECRSARATGRAFGISKSLILVKLAEFGIITKGEDGITNVHRERLDNIKRLHKASNPKKIEYGIEVPIVTPENIQKIKNENILMKHLFINHKMKEILSVKGRTVMQNQKIDLRMLKMLFDSIDEKQDLPKANDIKIINNMQSDNDKLHKLINSLDIDSNVLEIVNRDLSVDIENNDNNQTG